MNIELILFDLDDTLYPSSSGVWSKIRERIDLFMIEKLGYKFENVHEAREEFFRKFGTTLRGLESVHNIDTSDYLEFVHDIPLNSFIKPNLKLDKILSSIPIKKAIFTNADRNHAKRVTSALQISHHFDDVVDIIDVNPFCKPMLESFQIAISKLGINDPQKILLVDDNSRNIKVARSLGLETILVSENNVNFQNGQRQISRVEDLIESYPELINN